MKESTTADRLKQLMNERQLKQVDILRLCKPFCDKYGVKLAKNDLSQYVNGKSEPGQDKLTILSLALGVEETWLMGYNTTRTNASGISSELKINNLFQVEKKRFRLLGNIACGEPIFASEDAELYVEAGIDIKADFCLIARGDSMTGARIHDGDIVFIRQQEMVNDGEIAAILIDDEATLKRVYYDRDAGELSLYPENPNYKTLRYSGAELNKIRILGKAVAFQGDIL